MVIVAPNLSSQARALLGLDNLLQVAGLLPQHQHYL